MLTHPRTLPCFAVTLAVTGLAMVTLAERPVEGAMPKEYGLGLAFIIIGAMGLLTWYALGRTQTIVATYRMGYKQGRHDSAHLIRDLVGCVGEDEAA